MLDAGFLRTMYNMIAVATDKPYLHNVSNDDGTTSFVPEKGKKKCITWWSVPCENVLCVIVPQVDLGRSPVGDAPCLKVHHSHKFGFFVQLATQQASFHPGGSRMGVGNSHDIPIVTSIQTGWLPVSSAICLTSGK